MRLFNMLVSRAIMSGKVIIDTPNLDIDELERLLHDSSAETVRKISEVVYSEELCDREKMTVLQDMLNEWW